MKILKILTVAACALGIAAAAPAQAQEGLMGRLLGGGGQQRSSGDTSGFVADAVRSTQLMMVSAKILAAAAQRREDRDALRAEIDAIQSLSSPAELDAREESFQADLSVIRQNAGDAAQAQALYESSTAEQRGLLLDAGYNFLIAMLINERLYGQGQALGGDIMRNPLRAGSLLELRPVIGLVGMQYSAVRSMGDPLRALLARGGVQAPQDADSTEPRVIDL